MSRGPTDPSRVCACPQLIGRLHTDTVPPSLVEKANALQASPVAQPETSASLEIGGNLRLTESRTRDLGGDPLRCLVQCHGGRSGSRCHNRRRLPTELREAPPVSAKDLQPQSWRLLPETTGVAVAETEVSLLVSPSGRLGSLVPLLLLRCPSPFPTPSVPGSGQSPQHSENTGEISPAPTREGAPSLGHRDRDQLGAHSPKPETRRSLEH